MLEKSTQITVITYDQLKIDMLRLFDEIDDIQLDVPNVYEQLQSLLEDRKVLNHDITSNLPTRRRREYLVN